MKIPNTIFPTNDVPKKNKINPANSAGAIVLGKAIPPSLSFSFFPLFSSFFSFFSFIFFFYFFLFFNTLLFLLIFFFLLFIFLFSFHFFWYSSHSFFLKKLSSHFFPWYFSHSCFFSFFVFSFSFFLLLFSVFLFSSMYPYPTFLYFSFFVIYSIFQSKEFSLLFFLFLHIQNQNVLYLVRFLGIFGVSYYFLRIFLLIDLWFVDCIPLHIVVFSEFFLKIYKIYWLRRMPKFSISNHGEYYKSCMPKIIEIWRFCAIVFFQSFLKNIDWSKMYAISEIIMLQI